MLFPPMPGMPGLPPGMPPGLPPGMPPMPPMGMGAPGMMPPPPMLGGMPPEISDIMEAIASINQPTAGDYINHAIAFLGKARKLDDKAAPVVSRAIDILKGQCGPDGNNDMGEDDDADESSPGGPSSKSSAY